MKNIYLKTKKTLLLAMALAFSFALQAQQIQIGTAQGADFYKPISHQYKYSVSQQIYTAEEIGMPCRITELQFYRLMGTGPQRNIKVFMVHTEKASFDGNTDWVALSNDDLVYEGPYTAGTATWSSITLDTPFEYNGTDNLAICFWDASVNTAFYLYWYYNSGAIRSLFAYNNATEYDPFNLSSINGTTSANLNCIRLIIELNGTNLVVTPNPIELGYRPVGAWAPPFEVQLSNYGSNATLTTMTCTNENFTAGGIDLPANLNFGQSTTFTMDMAATAPGSYEAQLAIAYDERGVALFPVNGTAYTPVCPDVWELAQTVTGFPYTDTPTNLYDNYRLPGTASDGPDAVYALTFENDVLLTAGVTSGENGKVALYTADFSGEDGPKATNSYAANDQINGLTVPAGSYYLVTSSTTENFTVSINTETIPLPVAATDPTPTDGQTNVNINNLTLHWNLGEYTTEYQLLIGLSYFPNQVLVDWTSDLAESFTLTEALLNNRNYFWRVNERNSSGTTTGTTWGFTTRLIAPIGLTADETLIYEGEDVYLSWNAVSDGAVQGYNVYQMPGNSYNWNNGVKINETPITETQYTVSDLAYSMVGYKFCVRAAYDVGESDGSNQVLVKVSGTGSIAGHVYEQDETTPIAEATVTVSGNDEHGRAREYTFVTDNEGAYNGTLYVGSSYIAKANKEGYQEGTHSGSVHIIYDTNTPDVDIYLTETYYPVGSVIADYYPEAGNPESPYVKVTWSWEGGLNPHAQPEWLTYSNDYYYTNVGYNGNPVQWGYKWQANYLSPYAGFNLTKVALYSDVEGWTGGTYTCTIYSGEDQPTTALSSITVNVPNGYGDYEEYDLADPVEITGEETLWMIWNTTGVQYPASACTVPDLFFNGSWWNSTGTWQQLPYGAWMMKAYATNRSGRSTTLMCASDDVAQHKQLEPVPFTPSPDMGEPQVTNTVKPELPATAPKPDRSFQYFSVYRTECYNDGPYTEENTVLLASELTDTVYIDVSWQDAEPGVYKWGVQTHYAGNRSSSIVWNESLMNHLSQEPIAIQEVPVGEITPSAGLSPYPTYVPDTNLLIRGGRPFGSRATAMQGFGPSDQRFYHWTFPDIESMQQIGASSNFIINSIEKVGDTYYFSSANGNLFGTIDIETGEQTVISSDNLYHHIAYNPVDGKMYGTRANSANLYTIDLETGAATFDRVLDPFAGWMMGPQTMAINNDGIIIWVLGIAGDDWSNQIMAKDLATNQWVNGIGGFLGPYEGGYTYAQSMTCDRETNTFYWACYGRPSWGYPFEAALVELDIIAKSYNIIGYFTRETFGFSFIPETPSVGGNSVWSNCLEKGMSLGEDEVSINVLLNSADSPEGTVVSLTNYNEQEQELYPVEDVVLDETGYYAWDSFRKGNYRVRVSKDGYQTVTDSVGIWEATDLRYVLTEKLNTVEDLYVSHTGWAMWEEPQMSANEAWLHYDNGVYLTSVGVSSWSWTFYWGIMFPAEEMMQYNGFVLPKVALCACQAANYTVNIYEGGDEMPETLIATQEFYVTASYHMEEIILETPPVIDGSKNLWITVYFYGANYPAAACANTGSPNGRWFSTSGVTWSEYLLYGEPITWMLRGFVTDDRGRSIEIGAKENEDERHLEYYKVMCTSVDGEPIFNTNSEDPFCQLETESLVEGETYLCKVAPMYTTGLGAWTEIPWIYEPCEQYEGTENGVTVEGNTISWEYPGGNNPNPGQGSTTFTEGFEGGLNGWTVLNVNADGGTWVHSDNNPGGYSYGSLAHGGSGFAMCYSYIDYVGAFDTDSYLISPEKYTITANSQLHFYADNANDSYPENFSVCLTTADNPGASDFTAVWSGGAKGKGGEKANVRHDGERYQNWREHTVDLSAYAGQDVYIAFHDVNYDEYEIWIDDVELSDGAKDTREGEWYYYDDGVNVSAVGTNGGPLWWGIMLPAGSYNGNWLTKVSAYDYMAMSGNVTIYNDGDFAPAGSPLGQTDVTFTGSNDFIEFPLTEPVVLNPNKNVWVVFCNLSGATFPAAVCANTGDPNGRWVSLDGFAWADMATTYGLDYTFMVRAYIDDNGTGPVSDDILGAMVFADGEWVAYVPAPMSSYIYEGYANEVCVRMVHNGPMDGTYYSMSCPECVDWSNGCEPGGPVSGEYYYESDSDFGTLISWEAGSDDVVSYKVYRSTANVNYEHIGSVDAVAGTTQYEYRDPIGAGTYYYRVTAVYANGCESAPAPSATDPTVNYVVIDVTSVGENANEVSLYPNPTDGIVTIKAQDMSRITMTSVLGQVVFDAELTADEYTLNMARFNAGMYMVRITTTNGTVVKRLTLVK